MNVLHHPEEYKLHYVTESWNPLELQIQEYLFVDVGVLEIIP